MKNHVVLASFILVIGIGTYDVRNETKEILEHAVELGLKLIDTLKN